MERNYQTSSDEHAYLEPEAIVAVPDHATDAVILYAPVQIRSFCGTRWPRRLG
jgi:CO/xanthine dehydrogenase Mo-binding subunit